MDNDERDATNAFLTTDVFGQQVCLPVARWTGHILAAHPEMHAYIARIEEVIAHPQCVYESESDPNAKLFYQQGSVQGNYRNLYLKVVVSYSTKPAVVKTAFFCTALTGGRLLWIKFP